MGFQFWIKEDSEDECLTERGSDIIISNHECYGMKTECAYHPEQIMLQPFLVCQQALLTAMDLIQKRTFHINSNRNSAPRLFYVLTLFRQTQEINEPTYSQWLFLEPPDITKIIVTFLIMGSQCQDYGLLHFIVYVQLSS